MRTPQAPERGPSSGLRPDTTQAFLVDSASDLMQVTSSGQHHFPKETSFFVP